ncbi:MAG: ribonuclease HI family protein [Thermoplasmatota archaeon]|nr:ribonuclease HI family protein [Candidatus Thermoplasmatota archaeon]MBU1914040.1 ribonuclease HI family protein [Candidatus Thermoplasmatota archaeon]
MPVVSKLIVYTDGGSRGNPGPAAIAYVMYDSVGSIIEKDSKSIGRHTNNEAEYEAVLWAIERIRERSCLSVKVFTDSEFVVKQVKGIYVRKDPRMAQYARRVEANLRLFDSFELNHVPRTNPRQAMVDSMVNAALDANS